MKGFYTLLLFTAVFFSSSCKKQAIAPIDFTKYTITDSNCTVLGEADITDWTKDSLWSDKEIALMNFDNVVALTDSFMGIVNISPICPNPNGGSFVFGVSTEHQCKMKIACVNTEMEALYYSGHHLTGGPATIAIDLHTYTAFHKQENYRLYYAFYNAVDSMYYKGHGDFRIE